VIDPSSPAEKFLPPNGSIVVLSQRRGENSAAFCSFWPALCLGHVAAADPPGRRNDRVCRVMTSCFHGQSR
jgi:hypothetical protein